MDIPSKTLIEPMSAEISIGVLNFSYYLSVVDFCFRQACYSKILKTFTNIVVLETILKPDEEEAKRCAIFWLSVLILL